MEKAIYFTRGMGFEDYVADDKTVFAVIRALEIVGEAAKNIPESVRRKHPEIPWRAMAGMRDVLAHRYFGVDRAAVWLAG